MAASPTNYKTEEIRNIAIVGHSGAGKTTLVEALLAKAGAIHSAGSVEKGTSVCDFSAQEKQSQHSYNTAVCHLNHDGTHINLIDTPGYPDFIGRSFSILPAVETAAVVINADSGIEMVAHRMMEFAAERNMVRMIIVNKIDHPGIDLHGLLRQIRDIFGKECLPLNLPASDAKTVADCFFELSDDAPDFASVEAAHTEMVDQVVELDDELMEVYLEQGDELSAEQLHDPFERALRDGHLIPVCFVSGHTGSGLNQLLNIFSKLMPNPKEGNPPQFMKGDGADAEPVTVEPDSSKHVIGHVFKVTVDPYVGKLGIFRLHQGAVKTNQQMYVGEGRKGFKVAHLYKIQGKESKEIPKCIPGDICAVAKVETIHFDSVLHDSHEEDNYHLKSLKLPPPMHGVAIEPCKRGDEQKLSETLHKMIDEDPSLTLEHNVSANETVLRGMGDLHLRAVLERMEQEYNVTVNTRPPTIAYRETISKSAEGHYRHKKQTGGAGQFGEVYLKVDPLPRGSNFEFVNKVVGGSIPSQFIPAVEKGVRQVLNHGAIAGYPMQDIRVTVYDGKYHSVDSKEVAFVAAGKKAFMDAIGKASPIVLEPIASIEVTAPDGYVGDITGHLSGSRGRISGNDALGGNQVKISAQVPVSEMSDYQSTLKSLTGGEGAYTMAFDHYEPVPPRTQKDLQSAFRPRDEAD